MLRETNIRRAARPWGFLTASSESSVSEPDCPIALVPFRADGDWVRESLRGELPLKTPFNGFEACFWDGEGVDEVSLSLSMSASIFATFERGVKYPGIGEPEAPTGDNISILSVYARYECCICLLLGIR